MLYGRRLHHTGPVRHGGGGGRARGRHPDDGVARGDHVRANRRREIHRAAYGRRHGKQMGRGRARPPGHLRRPHSAQRIPVPGFQGRVPTYVSGGGRHATKVSVFFFRFLSLLKRLKSILFCISNTRKRSNDNISSGKNI